MGCDASASGSIDAGDLTCISNLIFTPDFTCLARHPVSNNPPRLTLPSELTVADGKVTVTVVIEPGDIDINATILALDYDENRLAFVDEFGAVRYYGNPASMRSVRFDPQDLGGELKVVIADLIFTPRPLIAGRLLEVDLQVLEPVSGIVAGAVGFSDNPPASFGAPNGSSIAGRAEVLTVPLFIDGFESGNFLSWSLIEP